MSQIGNNKRSFLLNETAIFEKSKWVYYSKGLYYGKTFLTQDEIKKQSERALNRNADAVSIMNAINDLSLKYAVEDESFIMYRHHKRNIGDRGLKKQSEIVQKIRLDQLPKLSNNEKIDIIKSFLYE